MNESASGRRNSPSGLSIFLLCLAFGLALFTAWGPTFEHLSDPEWTQHQKLHVFREVFLATVFCLAGIALALGPLRKSRPYSLEAVGVLGIGVVAGFWVGLPITGIGKDELAPYINHGAQLAGLLGGYWLARSSQRGRRLP